MATRTGDAVADQLIEAFKQSNPEVCADGPRLDRMHDAMRSRGFCEDTSRLFLEFEDEHRLPDGYVLSVRDVEVPFDLYPHVRGYGADGDPHTVNTLTTPRGRRVRDRLDGIPVRIQVVPARTEADRPRVPQPLVGATTLHGPEPRYFRLVKLFRSNTATPSETFCRFLVAASQDDRLSRVRARRLSRLVARNGQRRSLHGFYAGR